MQFKEEGTIHEQMKRNRAGGASRPVRLRL